MAVRTSMLALIATTRAFVGDVATPVDLQDQDVQDALDAAREEVRYELLSPMPDIQPGQNGSTNANFVWASYQSDYRYWENDVVLQGINTATGLPWAILSPATFEYIPGKWTMSVVLPAIATPPGQFPPVWATGKVYDVYAAAAELLERRIALRSFSMFDFTADGRSMHLNQVLDRWEKLREGYVAKSWNHTVELVRSDLAADYGHPHSASNNLLPDALSDAARGRGGY